MVVTTAALSADRVSASAPVVRSQMAARDAVAPVVQLAGRLVSRLSRSFSQSVPKAPPAEARQLQAVVTRAPARPVDPSVLFVPATLSPFHFRLPPPIA